MKMGLSIPFNSAFPNQILSKYDNLQCSSPAVCMTELLQQLGNPDLFPPQTSSLGLSHYYKYMFKATHWVHDWAEIWTQVKVQHSVNWTTLADNWQDTQWRKATQSYLCSAQCCSALTGWNTTERLNREATSQWKKHTLPETCYTDWKTRPSRYINASAHATSLDTHIKDCCKIIRK